MHPPNQHPPTPVLSLHRNPQDKGMQIELFVLSPTLSLARRWYKKSPPKAVNEKPILAVVAMFSEKAFSLNLNLKLFMSTLMNSKVH